MSTVVPDPRRWWALILLCVAQFIVILDTSIIGVALPSIQTALEFSQSDLQWVFNAYVVAFGGLLLLGGRLADIFGRRRLFVAGFATLTVASLWAGVAWSAETLVAARAAQGIGAALIAPAALSMVLSLFSSPRELTKALGFWGASAAAGGTAGVFLGGVITEWLTWRWVFLVNVPLGVAVLLLAPMLLQASRGQRGKVDYVGAFVVTAGLSLTVYGIVTAEEAGWLSAQTVGLLFASLALFGLFLLVERRLSQPLVPLGIFRVHNLAAANLVMALLGGAWIPMWFFLNLYLQQLLGYSAFETGLALLPMTVTIMVLMVGGTSRAIARFGFRPNLIVGLLLLGGALVLFGFLPTDGSFALNVLPASLLAAAGMSLSYIPATIAGVSGANGEEAGLASGLVNTTYQVGSAFGLAAMVAVSNGVGDVATLSGLNDGFKAAFFGAAGIAFLAVLVALAAVRPPQDSRSAANDAVGEFLEAA